MVLLICMAILCAVFFPQHQDAQAERMYDYVLMADKTVMIVGYHGNDSEVEIPAELNGHTVWAIAEQAFSQSYGMTRMHLPAGIQSIASGVFSFCENLTEFSVAEDNPVFQAVDGVLFDKTQKRLHTFPAGKAAGVYEIPEGTREIGAFAFRMLSGTLDVMIPASVARIQDHAFSWGLGIRSIRVSDDNTAFASLDGVLFDKQLRRLMIYPAGRPDAIYHIPKGTRTVAGGAFQDSQYLKEVIIPEGVAALEGDSIFSHSRSLKSVSLPGSLTAIGHYLFYACSRLTHVSLPEGLTQIPPYMFAGCSSLKEIVLPDGLLAIGEGAFSGCDGLREIQLPDGLEEIGNSAFSNCRNIEGITLPEGIAAIGESAFSGCLGMLEIYLPQSIADIGEDAFARCDSIVLWVEEGSLGQTYAMAHGIPYIIHPDWLK